MDKAVRRGKRQHQSDYLTLMGFREGAGPIRKFRIRPGVVWAALAAVVCLLVLTAGSIYLYRNSLVTIGQLERALNAERESNAQLSDRNALLESRIQEFALEVDKLRLSLKRMADAGQQVSALLEEIKAVPPEKLLLGKASVGVLEISAGSAAVGGPSEPRDDDILNWIDTTLSSLKEQSREREGDLRALAVSAREYQRLLDHTPSIWPVEGNVTSEFGSRIHPIDLTKQYHEGIDIACESGAPVRATADGVVKFAGWKDGYGRTVIIDHGNGISTLYAHNSSISVRKGETVKRGQQVAKAGSTGNSTGPHVHYEVQRNGRAVNPRLYLPTR